jgi:hypothetical protein
VFNDCLVTTIEPGNLALFKSKVSDQVETNTIDGSYLSLDISGMIP